MDGWDTPDAGWYGLRASHAAFEVDQVLVGRYRIVALMHGGLTGSVYQAVDQLLPPRHVAIKTAAPGAGTARLTLEAEVLTRLRHPAIPQVLDLFQEGEVGCLVCEFLPGRTLAELSAAPRTHVEVLDWGLRLCDVLTFLHTGVAQLCHGSLHARHCVLLTGGRLVLLDFGSVIPAKPVNCQVDTRSLALLLHSLVHGAPPAARSSVSLEPLLWATAQGAEGAAITIAALRRHLLDCAAEAGLNWGLCPYCQATTRTRARHCGACGSPLDRAETAKLDPPPLAAAPVTSAPPPPVPTAAATPRAGSGPPRIGGYVARLRAVGRYIDQQGLRRIALMESDDGIIIRGQTDGVGRLAHFSPRTVVSATLRPDDLSCLLSQAQERRGHSSRSGRPAAGVLGSALFPHGYEDRLRALGSEIDGLHGVCLLTLIESQDTLFLDYDRTDEDLAGATAHRHLSITASDLQTLQAQAIARRGRGAGRSLLHLINREQESARHHSPP